MLKAVLTAEEWGGLSADVQEHYALVEEDGSYRLNVSPVGGFEFANTAALKAALQKERTARSGFESKYKALTETVGDLDLNAAREAVVKLAEMGDWDPEKKLAEAKAQFEAQVNEKYEKLLGNAKAVAAKEKAEAASALEATRTQLQKNLIASTGTQAISAAGGSIELLLPIVERMTRMTQGEDGRFSAEVLDVAGNQRLSPKASVTEPMSIAELVEELKVDEKYARAFNGTGASGSGSSRSAAGGGAPSGSKTVAKSDLAAIGKNLADIASGKVAVTDG